MRMHRFMAVFLMATACAAFATSADAQASPAAARKVRVLIVDTFPAFVPARAKAAPAVIVRRPARLGGTAAYIRRTSLTDETVASALRAASSTQRAPGAAQPTIAIEAISARVTSPPTAAQQVAAVRIRTRLQQRLTEGRPSLTVTIK